MSRNDDLIDKQEQEFAQKLELSILRHEYKKQLVRLGKMYFLAKELVSKFCNQFPAIDKELNDIYTRLFDSIELTIKEIQDGLDSKADDPRYPSEYISKDIFSEHYFRPFTNLYTAEKGLNEIGIKNIEPNVLNWPEIRSRMNNFLGYIKSIVGPKDKRDIQGDQDDVVNEVNEYLTQPSERVIRKGAKYKLRVSWPDNFYWDNEKSRLVLGKEYMTFYANNGFRIQLMKVLAERRGGFVATSVLRKITPNAWQELNAIQNKRIAGNEKIKELVAIDCTGNPIKGEYRLVPYPKKYLL
jgi:hypothetical protein